MSSEPMFRPVTSEQWSDLLELFGLGGASSGCWCMWFRKVNAEYTQPGRGGANRASLQALVDGGREPGILAYVDERPVGWVSVAPRAEYTRISGVPASATDDVPPDDVWSVVCFYIDKAYRGQGIGKALLAEAVRYAGAHGAKIVEGYPSPPRDRPTADDNVFTGVVSMFRQAGFREVGRFARWRAVIGVTDPVDPRPGPPTGRPIHRLAISPGRRTVARRAAPARARTRPDPPASP